MPVLQPIAGSSNRRSVTLLTVGLLVVAVPVWPVSSIPPPTPSDSAGCSGSTFVVDRAVCADPDLLEADRQVRVPTAEQSRRLDAASDFVERQQAWFNRRNACAFSKDQLPCLRDSYAERQAVFAALEADPRTGRAGVCGAQAVTIQTVTSTVLIHDGDRLFAVGLPKAKSSWRNFLIVRQRGKEMRLQRIDGQELDCR